MFSDDSNRTLLTCWSKNLEKHVSELLAKFIEDDMTKIELKYHKNCLTEPYNRVKSEQNDEKNKNELFTIVEGND